jgi:16S rRNA (guanine527-N7)-methyltransferase
LLDIGSGGGFPGIPLKILRPDLQVTMIDGSRKKVNFQKHVIRTLGLKSIEARHIRSEELEKETGTSSEVFDVIVSKAVSKIDKFFEQGLPLLRRPGLLIAMKGPSVEAEIEAVRGRIEAEGFAISVQEYRLPHLELDRSLVLLSRPAETP